VVQKCKDSRSALNDDPEKNRADHEPRTLSLIRGDRRAKIQEKHCKKNYIMLRIP
jgi:hypothetical protein